MPDASASRAELPSLRGDRPPAELDERLHASLDRLTAAGLEGRLAARALGTPSDQKPERRMAL